MTTIEAAFNAIKDGMDSEKQLDILLDYMLSTQKNILTSHARKMPDLMAYYKEELSAVKVLIGNL